LGEIDTNSSLATTDELEAKLTSCIERFENILFFGIK
jgi:hypothetical protein